MAWTFNDIRIYTDKYDFRKERNIARLNPVSGSTILHIFGKDSKVLNLGGLVATDTDRSSLEALIDSTASYTVSGPEGTLGDYYIKSLKIARSPITHICLFDRPSISGNAPVYEVEMELYIDS